MTKAVQLRGPWFLNNELVAQFSLRAITTGLCVKAPIKELKRLFKNIFRHLFHF